MIIPISTVGPIGAIPVIGPIFLGIVGALDIIGAIFGITFGSSAIDQLEQGVLKLQTALTTAVQQLTGFIWTLAYAFGKLLQWVHDAFVGFLTTMWELLKKLAGWMKDVIGTVLPKLLSLIQRLRQLMNLIYLQYIRPILIWIQRARQWLSILRAFHIGWATKLDTWLGQLQGKVLAPYLYVLRAINGVGSWVNLIVTAAGLIQRAVFINTMYAYQKDWVGMWWNGQTPPAGTPTPPPAPAQFQPTPLPAVTAQLQEYVSVRAGQTAADVSDSMQTALAFNPNLPVVG